MKRLEHTNVGSECRRHMCELTSSAEARLLAGLCFCSDRRCKQPVRRAGRLPELQATAANGAASASVNTTYSFSCSASY